MVVAAQSGRRKRLSEIAQKIGRRRLLWFGVRGSDAESLLDLPQFDGCFGITVPLDAMTLPDEVNLEGLKKRRVNLNRYSTDMDPSPFVRTLQGALKQACEAPSVLATYRPATLLASVYFPRRTTVTYLGMFHEQQSMFEHKPWVEHELSKEVRIVPWRYLEDRDIEVALGAVRHGPQVMRANRSSGGVGLSLIRTPEEARRRIPAHKDGFFALAPFLTPNIPINLSACVFPDGSISVHAPSLQLIGIPGCTRLPFGYCGNDFARVGDLDDAILDELDEIATRVGRWLHSKQYVGSFGIDALVYEGSVYLAEINARFQGSTAVAVRLSIEMDESDVLLDHLAAFLDCPPPRRRRVRDLARAQPKMAHVVCFNTRRHALARLPGMPHPSDPDIQGLSAMNIVVDPEAMLFKLVVTGAVTDDGQQVGAQIHDRVRAIARTAFTAKLPPLESAGAPPTPTRLGHP